MEIRTQVNCGGLFTILSAVEEQGDRKEGAGCAPEARDGWVKVTVAVEVNIKVTAVCQSISLPRLIPCSVPASVGDAEDGMSRS